MGLQNVLKVIVVDISQFCEFTKSHRIVPSEWVNYKAGKLHLNNVTETY